MSSISVTVTQQDIDEGIRRTHTYCMFSTALARVVPEATHISSAIDGVRFTLRERHQRYIYLAPPEVQRYIREYDDDLPITPFSCVLENPVVVDIPPRTARRHIVNRTVPGRTGSRTGRIRGVPRR